MPYRKADYAKGFVYALASPDRLGVYGGSTGMSLKARMNGHMRAYHLWVQEGRPRDRYCTAFPIIATGTARMVKLYDYPCANLKELEAEEYRQIARMPLAVNTRRGAYHSEKTKAWQRIYAKWCRSHMGTLARSYPLFA